MLKTDNAIEASLNVNWSSVKNSIIRKLEKSVNKSPSFFFTEHDIHSALYSLTLRELEQHGVLYETTRDGYPVVLMHHEYPTPFRCYTKIKGSKLKGERPFKRSHYDLVILNPSFIRDNTLEVVCGKNYPKFKTAMNNVKDEPLIWACEIVFFPRTEKLPRNAVNIVKQEALKLKETQRYKVGDGVNFCLYTSILVFTKHETKKIQSLQRQVSKFVKGYRLKLDS